MNDNFAGQYFAGINNCIAGILDDNVAVPCMASERVLCMLERDVDRLRGNAGLDSYTSFLRSHGLGRNGLLVADAFAELLIEPRYSDYDFVCCVLSPAVRQSFQQYKEVYRRLGVQSRIANDVCSSWLASNLVSRLHWWSAPKNFLGDPLSLEMYALLFEGVCHEASPKLAEQLGLRYQKFVHERFGTDSLVLRLVRSGTPLEEQERQFKAGWKAYLQQIYSFLFPDASGHWETLLEEKIVGVCANYFASGRREL